MVVDFGRSCSVRTFFFFTAPPPIQNSAIPQAPGSRAAFVLYSYVPVQRRVRWYFAPPGALPLPFQTCWASSDWCDRYEKAEECYVGEFPRFDSFGRKVAIIPGIPKPGYSNGRPPPGITGTHYCGSQADFQIPKVWSNSLASIPRGVGNVPLCCNPSNAKCLILQVTLPATGPVKFVSPAAAPAGDLVLDQFIPAYDEFSLAETLPAEDNIVLGGPRLDDLLIFKITPLPNGYVFVLDSSPVKNGVVLTGGTIAKAPFVLGKRFIGKQPILLVAQPPASAPFRLAYGIVIPTPAPGSDIVLIGPGAAIGRLPRGWIRLQIPVVPPSYVATVECFGCGAPGSARYEFGPGDFQGGGGGGGGAYAFSTLLLIPGSMYYLTVPGAVGDFDGANTSFAALVIAENGKVGDLPYNGGNGGRAQQYDSPTVGDVTAAGGSGGGAFQFDGGGGGGGGGGRAGAPGADGQTCESTTGGTGGAPNGGYGGDYEGRPAQLGISLGGGGGGNSADSTGTPAIGYVGFLRIVWNNGTSGHVVVGPFQGFWTFPG